MRIGPFGRIADLRFGLIRLTVNGATGSNGFGFFETLQSGAGITKESMKKEGICDEVELVVMQYIFFFTSHANQ